MLVPFDQIPDHARVWVFQATTPFSQAQSEELQRIAVSFIENWTAHNRDLKASFKIIDQLFLVFSVDESAVGASGCSIDKLHQFIKGREQAMQLSLLNRLQVALPGLHHPTVYSLSDFTGRIKNGDVKEDQLVYDCTVTTKAELDKRFIAPLSDTWLQRYLIS